MQSDEQGVDGYTKLLLPVSVDGVNLVAVFSIRHQKDGSWYYNTVTVSDGKQEKRPGSYALPGAENRPLGKTPITGLADFIRRPLSRVNPDTVSKVIDPEAGEPMVVYHQTDSGFTVCDLPKAERAAFGAGHYFTTTLDTNKQTATVTGKNVMGVFLNIRDAADSTNVRRVMESIGSERFTFEQQVERGRVVSAHLSGQGFDGVRLDTDVVVFSPDQIKSATGNTGAFSKDNDDIWIRKSTARHSMMAPGSVSLAAS